ncbi:hypothetical protein L7F22_008270 [Adiantum nelumboides]|nr:hypothetical protein [Adiantum nelumboides]
MSHPLSPRQAPSSPHYEDASMHPEFTTNNTQMEQMLQTISNMMLHVSHTNQALLNYLSTAAPHTQKPDSKIRPKYFSGFPTKDVLTWLDHFDNVASYHCWSDDRKAMEARTLLEGVATTWFIQQSEDVKSDWGMLKSLLIQNFAHQNITQSALQQLHVLALPCQRK